MWRRKVKKHAKRKANNPAPVTDKRRKVEESSLEKSSPGRRVRLLFDSDEGECSRKVICVSDANRAGSPEPGSCLTLSVPELDSIVTVWSHIDLQEVQKPESSETMMRDILGMISEPSGSKELSGDLSISKPRVGMSSRTVKSPTPKIADTKVYTYDEMIEHGEKLNDSDDFEYDISYVEKKF